MRLVPIACSGLPRCFDHQRMLTHLFPFPCVSYFLGCAAEVAAEGGKPAPRLFKRKLAAKGVKVPVGGGAAAE